MVERSTPFYLRGCFSNNASYETYMHDPTEGQANIINVNNETFLGFWIKE